MGFKAGHLKPVLFASLIIIFLIVLFIWRSCLKTNPPEDQGVETTSPIHEEPAQEAALKSNMQNAPNVPALGQDQVSEASAEEGAVIQQQLDRDREEQKQTKYLKTKLEQTNLELEQEKALAQINKLKIENMGTFKDTGMDGQKGLPEVAIEYIGGDNVKKEAILSIAGTSYQVKEKSSPTDNIQVVSISSSSVTLHFSAPQELTKTIDYKPE